MLESHVKSISNLDPEILLSIAKSGDPFTYAFIEKATEHQIEINFSTDSKGEIEAIISLDSNFEASFKEQSSFQKIKIKLKENATKTVLSLDDLVMLHSNNLLKMGFDVLRSISLSSEPITYSFIQNNDEYQAEITFDKQEIDSKLKMIINIETYINGKAEGKTKFIEAIQ